MKISSRTSKLLLAAAAVLVAGGCRETPATNPPERVKVDGDQVSVEEGSPFLKHLEITKVTKSKLGDSALKGVGQIIALANSPGALSAGLAWVELDAELCRSLGLDFKTMKDAHSGTAIGLTTVPAENASALKIGQNAEIARYGLVKTDVTATVLQLSPNKTQSGMTDVVFKIARGQDWYPGTNCEVRFPLSQVQAVSVPTTAILHEGLKEYAMREVAPRTFKIVPVFIIDETPEVVQVIGLGAEDSIVASGAILFKPVLRKFLRELKGVKP